jgi:hypothetical protein
MKTTLELTPSSSFIGKFRKGADKETSETIETILTHGVPKYWCAGLDAG